MGIERTLLQKAGSFKNALDPVIQGRFFGSKTGMSPWGWGIDCK